MNALEIAVFALALAGGTDPFICQLQMNRVSCTNGYVASRNGQGNIEFDNGVEVLRLMDGTLAFSNGITTHWGSAGWVQFSTGLAVRRDRDGSFRFSNGLVCRAEGNMAAICAHQG